VGGIHANGQASHFWHEADSEASIDRQVSTSVHVHPGWNGELCCSPNNARVRIDRPAPRVIVFWAACLEDSREISGMRSPRACVSLHWLITDPSVAKLSTRAADDARTLGDFFKRASQFGGMTLPLRAAKLAFLCDGQDSVAHGPIVTCPSQSQPTFWNKLLGTFECVAGDHGVPIQ